MNIRFLTIFALAASVFSATVVVAAEDQGSNKNNCMWNGKEYSEGAAFCMFKNLYGYCTAGKWKTETNANCDVNPSLTPGATHSSDGN